MKRAVRLLGALALAGCGAARGGLRDPAPELARLVAELDSAFAAPQYARAQWGVVVRSLDNGEVLYRRNAARLFMPASNQKILTGAVALERLGPEFRFRTDVLAGGPRRGDTLAGDLVVVGRGDPTFSLRATDGTDVLASLRGFADSLRSRGITVITGRVRGDGSWFTDAPLGAGWMWDDLQDSYSAPVGALQFNESFAQLEIAPGDSAAAPARVRLIPSGAPLRVFSQVTTAPRDSNLRQVRRTRVFFTDSVVVTGRISQGQTPVRLDVAVTDPTRYFESALTQALREQGLEVRGEGPTPTPEPRALTPLFSLSSRPLRDILPLLEKPSQNQIAEALLRTLGGELRGVASEDSGRAVVRETLTSWGIPEDAHVYVDGSGLSRYNYVAPEAVAEVLVAISRHPHFQVFLDALPVAGVDGTLASRMQGTAAHGNARAKTGSIANVRTLSGYVTTRDGERLVFVLMANHFTVPRRVVEQTQDHVVERLANFTRRSRR